MASLQNPKWGSREIWACAQGIDSHFPGCLKVLPFSLRNRSLASPYTPTGCRTGWGGMNCETEKPQRGYMLCREETWQAHCKCMQITSSRLDLLAWAACRCLTLQGVPGDETQFQPHPLDSQATALSSSNQCKRGVWVTSLGLESQGRT